MLDAVVAAIIGILCSVIVSGTSLREKGGKCLSLVHENRSKLLALPCIVLLLPRVVGGPIFGKGISPRLLLRG